MSEADDAATLDALTAALDDVPGAAVLDRTSDRDHARSVFTVAGTPEAVAEAMIAAIAIAIERIDLRRQRGVHPRIGAVDVVPFVPLGRLTMADAARSARALAEIVADRHDLPVYLYGAAADDTDRRRLARIRRPGFEGLAAAMATADGRPDLGPPRPHPTAGAMAIGARPFLVAWNVQLASRDVDTARRIARRIRERDGGQPAVQALGLDLPSLGCVQLSMNVIDVERTPLWRVWETVAALAEDEGVATIDSELIGLVPAAALDAVADHLGIDPTLGRDERHIAAGRWLAIRDFEPTMTVEARLAAVRG